MKLARIFILLSCMTMLVACSDSPKANAPASAAQDALPPATQSPAALSTPTATPASPLAAYAFPATIDPDADYLFYLHGKIIEDQGLPAISPDYGEYQYLAILVIVPKLVKTWLNDCGAA